MEWQRNTIITSREVWDSQNGDFRIVRTGTRNWRLISFIHEGPDGELLVWDFATLAVAQQYAEAM